MMRTIDDVFNHMIIRAHPRGCECPSRCYLYAAQTFIWTERMHLPAGVRRGLRGIPVVLNAATTTESDGRTTLGSWNGSTITVFHEMVRRTASNGDWRGDMRRVFRHEVAHALGANHERIDAIGDLNG